MTERELLEWLSAVGPMVEWAITDDGKIRSTLTPERDCPLTHVGRSLAVFEMTPGHFFPDTAGRALGLQPSTVDRVVKAADSHRAADAALRSRLIAACGLRAPL